MNASEIRATLLRLLGEIAPEADLAVIQPDESLRDQLDIDSMDFLNFMLAIDKELHIDIPESSYAQLETLDGCVAYVQAQLQPQRTAG